MKRTMKTTFFITMLALWLPAQAAPLNDTGIAWSGQYPTGDAATCIAPAGQDCFQGRDKARADGTLAKTGHSAYDVNPVIGAYPNGFDYTKIAHDGTALPPAAALGTGADDWACTRDNVTGLLWSLQTPMIANWNQATAPTYPDAGQNSASRCGYASGWRLPTRRELLSIVHRGAYSPAVDSAYFPVTVSDSHWTADEYKPNTTGAWLVYLKDGTTVTEPKADPHFIRLVRSLP